MQRKNRWPIAERSGEDTPHGSQRLLNAAAGDTSTVRGDRRAYGLRAWVTQSNSGAGYTAQPYHAASLPDQNKREGYAFGGRFFSPALFSLVLFCPSLIYSTQRDRF